ncbi:uncharacterized protein LOC130645936 [Hydractinia symbiolongicarpus]|uniref:uncharacterized protein LOC130645936 n=1 Tax=Hydractinia symbiolongicarpus TaxID=13093 RepID=UPI00254CF11B|nr:uncharacterized protein LOC130645936 [Hydractinia symbiolongicarpus]
MDDYHDMYLTTDVLLLTDIFESFLNRTRFGMEGCVEVYRNQAGASYDPDMLLMFERGIRGGITQAVHRYAKANSKYMGEQYDLNEESSYLQYLDANNLYGWAMRQDLPTHGFKWLSNVEAFTEKWISKLVADNKHGYILEADINYPESLHDKHNDLPFLPERKVVHKVEKLIPNLEHKRRTAAKNDFNKDFYKLMNLSVFGKTMKNLRNHHNTQLVTNEKKYTKLVMKPNFKGGNYFSSHLMGVEMGKTEAKMNKPVYIGQAILDMSKVVIHEFHYDYMQPKYGSKLRICYMDTDSFVYHIRTEDFYRDIADDVEARFDTKANSKDDNRPLLIGKNKKVVGLMKDELNGKIMTEFINLRAKSMLTRVSRKRAVIAKRKEVNKLALNRADDKRIVQPDQITTLARDHYRLAAKESK